MPADIWQGVLNYVQAMLDRKRGMKVLILDAETLGIVSMVLSQSELLSREVFLVERIEQLDTREQVRNLELSAMCFLRPTNQNFILLTKELKAPKYREYHVFFSNTVSHHRLEHLANCDDQEVVHQVQEYFADVFAVGRDLFSLNLPSTSRMTQDPCQWSTYDERNFERIVDGLFAACLSMRMAPVVRFCAGSDLSRQVAEKLQLRMSEESSLVDQLVQEQSREATPVLLLLDRRNDPVTPMLNQWTYQAMIHELLGLENNRVNMSRVEGIRPELREIVVSASQDPWFDANQTANFGDLIQAVQAYMEEYKKETNYTAQVDSVEQMQAFVDKYPEFRRLSESVSKHVTLVSELDRIVRAHGLMEASELEQDLACSENRQEHYKAVAEMINGSKITHMERLRLVILYALRYEHHQASIKQLTDLLRSCGIGAEQTSLIDQVLRYAGSHARSGDLFQNRTFLAQAQAKILSNFQEVENVYTQHKSLVASIADELMKGRLKEAAYPTVTAGYRSAAASRSDQAAFNVIFVIGGATYEEARDVRDVNKTLEGGRRCVLGGTTIHNTRTFLADLAQLNARMAAAEQRHDALYEGLE